MAFIGTLTALVALQTGTEMRLMRNPDIFGNQIVFTYASDLWTMDISGGIARRLTSHPGSERYAKFSPDGKWIAFTGGYEGGADVFVMSSEGGEPKRLTFEPNFDQVVGWTKDGKIAYTSDYGSFTDRQSRLWFIDPDGGMPERTKLDECADLSFSPDGKKMAYNRMESHRFNWRRYRGGTQGRISIWDFSNNSYSELPSGRENSWFPMWVGDSIYYASDKDLNVNLYSYNVGSKRAEQLTKFKDGDIKWPSSDGKNIVFERNGFLCLYNIAAKTTKTLDARLISDKLVARPVNRRLGTAINDLTISPSGMRVAVHAHGEVFSLPARSGDIRNLTQTSGVREQQPIWSPDGKFIYVLSDKDGQNRIWQYPQMGGEPKVITTDPNLSIRTYNVSATGKYLLICASNGQVQTVDVETGKSDLVMTGRFGPPNASGYDWSPDDQWIAYTEGLNNLNQAIFLYNTKTKKTTQITDGYFNDGLVTFDLSGKYLYFSSQRTFQPRSGAFEFGMDMAEATRIYVLPLTSEQTNPLIPPSDEEPGEAKSRGGGGGPQPGPSGPPEVKIDFDGIASRAIPLPWGPGNYGTLLGLDNGVLTVGDNGLSMFDLGSRRGMDLLNGPIRGFSLTPRRNKLAMLFGNQVFISDLRPGMDPNQGRVATDGIEAILDPREEWKQMYWEAWRFTRDQFYDQDHLGLDWKAIGDKYAKFLPYLGDRADLNYLIGLMIGEHGTGHSYVNGGDPGIYTISTPPQAVGLLGCDFGVKDGGVVFQKIYKGLNFEEPRRGPLGDPGVNLKDGDFLLEIDGVAVKPNLNPNSLLQGKAGRYVTLTVNNKPGMEGSRKVRVRTIPDETNLRYIEWVEANRKKVNDLSGGRIGYMHVPDTSIQGMIEFIKGYYSQSDKEALVVDERFNGGGMIPSFFIEKLVRKSIAAFKYRNFDIVKLPAQAPEGPRAMLINEYAGSGGDMFPWYFKEYKLGPLIGKRTWGGLVGIQGMYPLLDGGGVSAPNAGIFDHITGKWIAENTGIDPDIDVDSRPDLLAQGRDPQLERAVEYLLDELKKRPTPKPNIPSFPKAPPVQP